MSNLHPVMQAALAPYLVPVKRTQAIPRPKPTESFSYTLCGIELQCELDYQAGESTTYDHPGSPENADLCEAFHKGEDIFQILSADQVLEIEIAFLEQDRSMDDSDPPERDEGDFNADETSFG